MEIDGPELLTEEDPVITVPELMSAMGVHKNGTDLREIIPITDSDLLVAMAKEHVRVIVGDVSGFMVPPGWSIKEHKTLQSFEQEWQRSHPENCQRDCKDFTKTEQQSREDLQLLHHIQFVLYDRQEIT